MAFESIKRFFGWTSKLTSKGQAQTGVLSRGVEHHSTVKAKRTKGGGLDLEDLAEDLADAAELAADVALVAGALALSERQDSVFDSTPIAPTTGGGGGFSGGGASSSYDSGSSDSSDSGSSNSDD